MIDCLIVDDLSTARKRPWGRNNVAVWGKRSDGGYLVGDDRRTDVRLITPPICLPVLTVLPRSVQYVPVMLNKTNLRD